jgi:hypothetical protein
MAIDFGLDTSCTDELRTGTYAKGLRIVAEACYRRLITRRGTLMGGEEEAEFGLRVGDYLGSVTSTGEIAKVQGLIKQELLKDQRIDSVSVTVTEVEAGPERTWTIEVEAITGQGPFDLVLSVDDVTTKIVGLTT